MTSICKFWSKQGHCFYGDDCKYRHVTEQSNQSIDQHVNQQIDEYAPPEPLQPELEHDLLGLHFNTAEYVPPSDPTPTFSFADGEWRHVADSCRRTMFIDERTRRRLLTVRAIELTRLDVEDPRIATLPASVDKQRYHSLTPIDPDLPPTAMRNTAAIVAEMTINRTTRPKVSLYKCESLIDGRPYLIRRYQSIERSTSEDEDRAIEPWIAFQHHESIDQPGDYSGHANLIALRRSFRTNEFGSGESTCLVYDYYGGSQSLQSIYFSSSPSAVTIDEPTLLSYACSILTAVSAVHAAGLSLHDALAIDRVLVTAPGRVKLNCMGATDLLQQRHGISPAHAQLEDLHRVGLIILSLALSAIGDQAEPPRSFSDPTALLRSALRTASMKYSPELCNVVAMCCGFQGNQGSQANQVRPTATQALSLLVSHLARSHSRIEAQLDARERDLMLEATNGRLLRSLVKLNLVSSSSFSSNEWDDSGNRYLTQLFLQSVFTSQQPSLDRIVNQLNLLEIGSPETCLLTSPDGDTAVIASFNQVKQSIDQLMHQLQSQVDQSLETGVADSQGL